MQSAIQGVGNTPTAYTPNITRSTKPRAMHMTSAMTICLSLTE